MTQFLYRLVAMSLLRNHAMRWASELPEPLVRSILQLAKFATTGVHPDNAEVARHAYIASAVSDIHCMTLLHSMSGPFRRARVVFKVKIATTYAFFSAIETLQEQ